MFIVRSFVISEAKTIELVVLPKSIPPVKTAPHFTIIVVPEVIVPLAEGIIIIARP